MKTAEQIIIKNSEIKYLDEVYNLENDSIGLWNVKQFEDELKSDISLFQVALIHNTVAGYIAAWHIADEIQINSLAVMPQYRKMGIAAGLIDSIIDSCSSEVSIIILEVRASNDLAVSFYKRYGFLATGIRKGFYQDDDALLMEKRLRM